MARSKNVTGRRRNLLIELGTEELPPKALLRLSEAFASTFYEGMIAAGMIENSADHCRAYATPRRLAVWLKGVLPKQPDTKELRIGPAVQAACDADGKPTAAAEGFARSCGVSVARLKPVSTEKGERLAYNQKVKGQSLGILVTKCLAESVKALPIPKRMRWADKDDEFVRPVHWLLALYGSDLVKTAVLGLKSNRFTLGHRFHCPGKIRVASADRYLNTLKTTGFVIADYQTRKGLIEKQVLRLASKNSAKADIDPALLEEVTGLVEWPVAFLGEFDCRFLALPREVLVSTMADHQKYFFLTTEKNKPLQKFIAVSNIKSKSPKRVRQGNERVLRARLSDAEFFWTTDQKQTLEQRIDSLKGVLFHFKLGSIYDKVQRVTQLSEHIASQIGADIEKTSRAASLCKTDLVTDMVGEFPELQGTIGRYYALNQGVDKAVAVAIEDHYKPRFAGDTLPTNALANCLALADRIDTMVGIFACNEIPSGDKDPFALRRAALGILRILIEGKLKLELRPLLEKALDNYRKSALEKISTDENIAAQVQQYIVERLKGYLQSMGYKPEYFAAVEVCSPASPLDFSIRVEAIARFFNKRKSSAESLASANKRIANMLEKADWHGSPKLVKKLFEDSSERELADKTLTLSREVAQAFDGGDYAAGLEALAGLKAPVDAFFDNVMVMHENLAIRNNRLTLLSMIRELFLGVADIAKIRVE